MKEAGFDMQEFVSIISHDFRAPIRHLRQFSAILADSLTAPTAEQKECAAFIKTSTDQCDGMMTALTQLSRIYTQKIDAVPIDFEAMFAEFGSELSVRNKCWPRLTSDCAAPPARMDLWHARLMVEELLKNAFKFRRKDSELAIHLSVSSRDDQLLIEILDNGIGMPAQFVDRCTNLYTQLDNSVEGVGKGLALVENIAKRYHGCVNVNSSQSPNDSGTAVTVALSLKSH